MNVSFDPIGSWYVVSLGCLDRDRPHALGLRPADARHDGTLALVRPRPAAECGLALPTGRLEAVGHPPAEEKTAGVRGLLDRRLQEHAVQGRGRRQGRWETARATLDLARPVAKNLETNLDVKYYQFDSTLREEPLASSEKAKEEPNGRETAAGDALLEAVKRQAGTQVAALVVLSDASNNAGYNPLSSPAGSAASKSRSRRSALVRRAPAPTQRHRDPWL